MGESRLPKRKRTDGVLCAFLLSGSLAKSNGSWMEKAEIEIIASTAEVNICTHLKSWIISPAESKPH